MMVKRRFSIHARLVVGADGTHSLVRQRLGVEYLRIAGPEYFAAYEFETDSPADAEVRVVLDQATTNVLWPLPGNKYRWTFQLIKSEIPTEFPEKERRSARVSQPAVEETMRQYVQKVARQRAPWFSASVKEIAWCTDVAFEHRLTKEFGRERCWLAGDAAHQTGPVGAQSMNAGLIEADALAERLTQVLRGHAALATLATYDQEGQANWRRLLGITGGLKPGSTTGDWVRERRARILPCLPASGAEDLAALAGQLGLDI
jgi:2-polyprenyl-6-methoxyphenol hydroxylase-like FAD-dependent oxidoreductase